MSLYMNYEVFINDLFDPVINFSGTTNESEDNHVRQV